MSTLAAYTEPGNSYPAYVSAVLRDDGMTELYVRTRGEANASHIVLDADALEALASELQHKILQHRHPVGHG